MTVGPGFTAARLPALRQPAGRPRGDWQRRPGRLVVGGFALAVLIGTGLLMLPAAHADGVTISPLAALFTATSAVCVTGLVVVDTGTAWSGFGQVVILALIQVGGFGIMTLATLLGLLLSRRLDLRSRLTAAVATRSDGLGDVRTVLLGAGVITILTQTGVALVLVARQVLTYGADLGDATWWGVFHATSAFNNAGFGLAADSLVQYQADPWVCLPLVLAVLVGGIGFPVLLELFRTRRRVSRWSLHTRITLVMTAVLVPVGTLAVLAGEWGNPGTLGPMPVSEKLLNALVHGVMPRTAGFNSLDMASLDEGTLLTTDVLMFIGGGSAGTAGGIKMTTFAVLLAVIWAELRGDPDVTVFDRRITPTSQRQALAVALLGVALVMVPTIVMSTTSDFGVSDILFEVVSAFATVGLSTGITAQLDGTHQLMLVALMFVGRLGPITFGTALALRERRRLFRHPEGAPLVG